MGENIIIFYAEYLPFVVAIIAVLFLILTKSFTQNLEALALTGVSSVFAFVFDKLLNKLIVSPRPFVIEDVSPLFSHVADNGFPSEHTLFACLFAAIVYVYDRKIGTILWFGAILVGFGQVAAKVHNIVDVLGSILIAITSVALGYYVCRKIKPSSQ